MVGIGAVTSLVFFTTLTFGAVDIVAIKYLVGPLYRHTFSAPGGDAVLRKVPHLIPGVVFYCIYIYGIISLVAEPALRLRNPNMTVRPGAILGMVAYGTYAFTDLSIINNFTWTLAITDTLWGATLTAFAAYIAVWCTIRIKAAGTVAPPVYDAVNPV